MQDRRCTICGWQEGADNGVELHTTHQAHILADLPRHESDRGFNAALHAQQMARETDRPVAVKPKAGTTHVWLVQDPETFRVAILTHEPADGDFPHGLRGVGWPVREADIPAADLARVLRAEATPAEQDDLHRSWWSQAAPEGTDPWPA
jgi:hypothetical protein